MLAAGAARRFGRAKQIEPLADGVSLIRHAVLAALEVCDEVRVVVGAHREAVIAALDGLPIRFIDNPNWQRGMGASIAAGFAALIADDVQRSALLCLADQPRVGASALRRLTDRLNQHPDAVIVSSYGSSRGPPCLFPPRLFAELAKLDGDEGARSVLKTQASEVIAVPMPEGADDIDTPEDYQRIIMNR